MSSSNYQSSSQFSSSESNISFPGCQRISSSTPKKATMKKTLDQFSFYNHSKLSESEAEIKKPQNISHCFNKSLSSSRVLKPDEATVVEDEVYDLTLNSLNRISLNETFESSNRSNFESKQVYNRPDRLNYKACFLPIPNPCSKVRPISTLEKPDESISSHSNFTEYSSYREEPNIVELSDEEDLQLARRSNKNEPVDLVGRLKNTIRSQESELNRCKRELRRQGEFVKQCKKIKDNFHSVSFNLHTV